MVKTIFLDEKANNLLNDLIQKGQETKTGLLIGTIDASKDYITLVIPTPKNEENTDQTDSSWFINHALLVHDMLVGGCDILGIYTIDQTPVFGRSFLNKIFKSLNEFDYYKEMKFNKDRLLFLVDTNKKSINMKSLDISVSDNKNYQTCELKVVKNLLKNEFTFLRTNFKLNSIFKIINVYSYNILKKDFLKAMPVDEYFKDEKFLCVINDELFCEDQQFSEIVKLVSSRDEELSVSLVENLNLEFSSKDKISNLDSNESIYELDGVCCIVVSFPKSFKLKNIKKLFIYDLMRSFNARVRLLVEDLDASKDIIGDVQHEEPNSADPSSIEESYQTPNRIKICLDEQSGQIITDYMFPDETDSDISERIKDLFECDLTDTKRQIVCLEDLPPEIKSGQGNDMNENSSSRKNSITFQSLSSCEDISEKSKINFGLISIVLLLISILIGLWIFVNNPTKL